MAAFKDLSGKYFGLWKVISVNPKRTVTGHIQYNCVCSCGNERVIPRANLQTYASVSCGCFKVKLQTKHGQAKRGAMSGAYRSWHKMMQRCYNPAADTHFNYGKKGIGVVEAWHKFENFYADMGDRPEGLTLDRIINSEDYGPENCRWATRKEQANNRG